MVTENPEQLPGTEPQLQQDEAQLQPATVAEPVEPVAGDKPEVAAKETPAKTYSEEEFRKLQSAADKKTAALEKQMQDAAGALQRAQVDQAKVNQQRVNAEISQMEHTYLERFGDTPESRQAVTEFVQRTRDVLSEGDRVAQMKQMYEANQPAIAENDRVATAYGLSVEFGVPIASLLESKSGNREEMRQQAMSLSHQAKLDELEQAKTKPQKFDSSASAKAAGANIDAMSADEKIKYGLELEAAGKRRVA